MLQLENSNICLKSFLLSFLHFFVTLKPYEGAARILQLYSLWVVNDNQNGRSEGSGKPLLCNPSYEKTGCRGEGESNVFLNLSCLVMTTPF